MPEVYRCHSERWSKDLVKQARSKRLLTTRWILQRKRLLSIYIKIYKTELFLDKYIVLKHLATAIACPHSGQHDGDRTSFQLETTSTRSQQKICDWQKAKDMCSGCLLSVLVRVGVGDAQSSEKRKVTKQAKYVNIAVPSRLVNIPINDFLRRDDRSPL